MKKLALLSAIALACTISLQGCAPAIIAGAGAAAVGGNSMASSVPLGTQVEDSVIKNKAFAIINKMPELVSGKSNVEISVFNRIVLLLGQVPTEQLKTEVAGKISKIAKVKLVYNNLSVGEPVSFGQYAKDAWITTKVKTEMLGHVNPSNYKVITENGIVYLMGYASHAEAKQAADIASGVSGVKKVVKAFRYTDKTTDAIAQENPTTAKDNQATPEQQANAAEAQANGPMQEGTPHREANNTARRRVTAPPKVSFDNNVPPPIEGS